MRGSYRLAQQTARWARFAVVDVEVNPSTDDHVAVTDGSADAMVQQAALHAGRQALRTLPGRNAIIITSVRTSPADTSVADIAEATMLAVWDAHSMPPRDASLYDRWLVEQRLIELQGRRLQAVTEARHWFGGVRDGDVASLVRPWLHFDSTPALQFHVLGDDLAVASSEPHQTFSMDEYGEIRVAPAQAPDILATLVGQQLRNSVALSGPGTSAHAIGAVLLEFTSTRIVIGAVADEWSLVGQSLGRLPRGRLDPKTVTEKAAGTRPWQLPHRLHPRARGLAGSEPIAARFAAETPIILRWSALR